MVASSSALRSPGMWERVPRGREEVQELGEPPPVSQQVCHSPGPEVQGGRVSSPDSSWPQPWAGRWAGAWRQTGELDLSRLGLTVSGAQLQRPVETTQHFLLQVSEPPWRKASRLN